MLTEQVIYKYTQVRINGDITVSKCLEAILKSFINEFGINLYDYLLSPFKDSESEELANEIYHNVKVDFGLEEPLTELEKAKKDKIKEINKYDISENINSFSINGLQVWLNKNERASRMGRLTAEKNAGKENTTLWFGNTCISMKCDAAIQMINALELYASECFDKTSEHKVAVQALGDLEEVKNYDYTTEYPDKLEFNIR